MRLERYATDGTMITSTALSPHYPISPAKNSADLTLCNGRYWIGGRDFDGVLSVDQFDHTDVRPVVFSPEPVSGPGKMSFIACPDGGSNPGSEYCSISGGNSPNWISSVELQRTGGAPHSILLNSSDDNSGYADFTDLLTEPVKAGSLVQIQLGQGNPFPNGEQLYWSVYLDANQNKIFEPQELLLAEASPGFIDSFIVIPQSALEGETRLRVVMSAGNPTDPCGSFPDGEAEDYTLTILPGDGPFYCSSWGDYSYPYIEMVELKRTDAGNEPIVTNQSGDNGGYFHFPPSSTQEALEAGSLVQVALAQGFHDQFPPTPDNQFWSIFLDKDQNGEFSPEERILHRESPGGVYTFMEIPADAISGLTRMRVVLSVGQDNGPCGPFPTGEVEDYTVLINPAPPFSLTIWYSRYW
jgi:hypothetical protein